MTIGDHAQPKMSLAKKLWQINWGLVVVLVVVAAFGLAMLYSAANGSTSPWASRQALRMGIGFMVMLGVALIDIRFWFRYSYVIYFGGIESRFGVLWRAGEALPDGFWHPEPAANQHAASCML